ncbi:MAG: peptidylprolyl isomerase [Actinomycetota bacterium]|nr:peptidylprolyl isomerase [Actinomycetota bacterium]
MKRQLCILATVAVLAAACGGGGGGPGTASGSTAASVGADDISTGTITDALGTFEDTQAFDQLSQQNGGEGKARRLFEQGYLSRLIRREVLQTRAADLGVSVPAADVAGQLEQIKAQFGDDEKQFQDALEQQGLTASLLKRFVEDQVLEQELRTKVAEEKGPPEDELRAYYEDNKGDYQEVRASHILLKSEGAPDAKKQADKLYSQLQDAPGPKVDSLFASLAKEFSQDGSAAQGGDLGWADPAGYVKPFGEAIEALPVGKISRPVETEFGFHIITVEGRRAQPYEAVKPQIATEIGGESPEQVWQDWIIDSYKDAEIEVNPRYGELDLETQQIVDATAEDVPGAEESPAE